MDNYKALLMIQLKNIVIGHRQPLFRVNELTLNTGELIALIGPNGVGKTTFLNTLIGSLPPLEGTINIHKTPLEKMTNKERIKTISFVASKFDGVPHLSVYDLIAMGRAPYTNFLHTLSQEDKDSVEDVIAHLGLTALKDKMTTSISDGERQLAMIGKAIAQETSLIVLDEPTAFLDYSNRLKIMSLLKELAEKYNKLILLSTHDLEIALRYASSLLAIGSESHSLLTYTPTVPKEKLVKEVFGINN